MWNGSRTFAKLRLHNLQKTLFALSRNQNERQKYITKHLTYPHSLKAIMQQFKLSKVIYEIKTRLAYKNTHTNR